MNTKPRLNMSPVLNSSISLVLKFPTAEKAESKKKTHLQDFAFVTQTSALYVREEWWNQGSLWWRSWQHYQWGLETATSNFKECSECLNLEKWIVLRRSVYNQYNTVNMRSLFAVSCLCVFLIMSIYKGVKNVLSIKSLYLAFEKY